MFSFIGSFEGFFLLQTSKGGSEEGDKVRKLQTEMAALQKQIFHKEDVNNRKLNFMKQDLKKAKQEYEKRVQNPKQQQSQIEQSEIEAASMNELAAQARVKELEAQVQSVNKASPQLSWWLETSYLWCFSGKYY